jgi:hypothetical protein
MFQLLNDNNTSSCLNGHARRRYDSWSSLYGLHDHALPPPLTPEYLSLRLHQTGCRWNEEVPVPLKRLVERCWDTDYDKRPNFDEICDLLEAEARQLGNGGMMNNQKVSSDKPGGDHSGGCCSVM